MRHLILALALTACGGPIYTSSNGVEYYSVQDPDHGIVEDVEALILHHYDQVPGHQREDVRECLRDLPVWVSPKPLPRSLQYRDEHVPTDFNRCDLATALARAVGRCYGDDSKTYKGVAFWACIGI